MLTYDVSRVHEPDAVTASGTSLHRVCYRSLISAALNFRTAQLGNAAVWAYSRLSRALFCTFVRLGEKPFLSSEKRLPGPVSGYTARELSLRPETTNYMILSD
jgi:hypothetical protein